MDLMPEGFEALWLEMKWEKREPNDSVISLFRGTISCKQDIKREYQKHSLPPFR